MRSHIGRKLVGELQRQMWRCVSDDQRIRVLNRRCRKQASVVLALERRVFKPHVANMFEEYKPRQKFNMWRRCMATSKARVLAKRYHLWKSRQRAVRALQANMLARRRRRRLRWLAR